MFSQIFMMAVALAGGIFAAYSNLPVILPVILLISIAFRKRRIFNAALAILFIAGYVLFFAYVNDSEAPGIYRKNVVVTKTMGSGYIVSDKGMYYMRFNYDIFEGDRVFGVFKVKPLRKSNDFDDYLNRINVHNYLIPVKIDSVSAGKGVPRLRVNIINRIRRNITDQDAAALSSAILTGYRNDMSRMQRDRFNRTGTAHLLAISGLHTGIIFMLVNLLLFFIPLKKQIKMTVALSVLIFFAILTYGNTPVVRAVIFIALYSVSCLMHRKVKDGAVLLTAAIVIMIINPFCILGISFWLSFSAVYIIIQMHKRTGNIIITLLLLPLLMIPLTGHVFGRFHILSSAVSLWLIPLFFVYIPGSFIAIVIKLHLIDKLLSFLFSVISRSVYFADILPLRADMEIDMYFASILGIILIMMMNRKYRFMLYCSVCLLIYVLI